MLAIAKYNVTSICWYNRSILLQNITKLTETVDKLLARDCMGDFLLADFVRACYFYAAVVQQ